MESPFLGGAYLARSSDISAQRCINLFPQIEDTNQGARIGGLIGCPGLDLLVTPKSATVRGLLARPSELLAVVGNKLYSINTSYGATEVGTLGTSSGQVSMADNGVQVFIADGGGYIYAGGVLTAIADADFSGAETVTFVDGYFAFNSPGTGLFMLTGLYDGANIDGLDFASAESDPDAVVAVMRSHDELWVFGEKTIEPFRNTGGIDFPFEAIQGTAIEMGLQARYSLARAGNTIFWLGQNDEGGGMVFMASGYVPQRISSHAIEKEIQGYSTAGDAIGFAYQQEGGMFYVLTFPSAGETWVYDLTASAKMGKPMWHQRAYWDVATASFTRYRANCYAYFNGNHIVGDYENGRIYKLNLSTYTDAGNTRRWLRSWQALQNPSPAWRHFGRLELFAETGVGLASGQGSDPQIMLRYSDDGGHTWTAEERCSMGAMGEYDSRVYWTRLGRSRSRVFEVSGTDPVKIGLFGADIEVT